MSINYRETAQEIHDLASKLASDGWDRMRGLRLYHAIKKVGEDSCQIQWIEATGRADELAEILENFIREAPKDDRLKLALQTAFGLAKLLENGRLTAHIDPRNLPKHPETWKFVLAGNISEGIEDLTEILATLGFSLVHATSANQAIEACRTGQCIFLATVSWFSENIALLTQILPSVTDTLPLSPLLVALTDTEDFRTQVKVRQAGVRLLLSMPLDPSRLLTALSGLAWLPRIPYRVLAVDDNLSILNLNAHILREAGFEVLAVNDPVAARDLLVEFGPEACLLDIEMPACRGTDLSALLRRNKRFAHLPVIYLSSFSDIEHQLDARNAGGEDYLVKPVDPRLLVTAVMARARQFRKLETVYRQRRQSLKQLENIKSALNAHSSVSITSSDGSIIDVNSKFCEVNGFRRNDLIGRNHRMVQSGHHPRITFEEMWETIIKGQTWQGELLNRKKNGETYWIASTIVPIFDEQGIPEQYISIRTDISEQKSVQTKLEHQVRLLEQLRQALNHFVSTQDILSTSRLLLESMLLQTGSTFGFIGEILRDLNDSPYIKSHALSDIAWDKNSRQLYDQALDTGMEFRNLDNLFGSVLRTGQTVIANDPSNDPRRGKLPIGHPTLNAFLGVPIYQGKELIGIIGLANCPNGYDLNTVERLKNITTAYANILEATRLRNYKQQVINEIHKSRGVDPQSKPQHSPPLFSTETTQLNKKQRRILVAEDSPANQAILIMQLDVLGYEADIADDCAIALAKWKQGGHDLILTDRNMPRMDGLELARAIRATERENGTYVPIIAISAINNPEDLALFTEAGIDEAISKPIELDNLQRVLTHWLIQSSPKARITQEAPAKIRTTEATLDLDYLVRVVGRIDKKQTRELVNLFIGTVHDELPSCRLYLTEGNYRALALSMHKLKSSARMVGALRFAAHAEKLEHAAKTEQLDNAKSLYTELKNALKDVEESASHLIQSVPTVSDHYVTLSIDTPMPRYVLIVDDDAVARRQISMLLSRLNIKKVECIDNATQALLLLEKNNDIDLVISDLNMPGMDGIEFLRRLADSGYKKNILLASGVDEQLLQTAAEVIRSKKLNLIGTLKKPVMHDTLLELLVQHSIQHKPVQTPRPTVTVTREEILEGILLNEFEVHFQPKVDAATLRVVGVESLARWQRNGKFIPPDIFITTAEQHNLITQLSEVLVAKALIGGVQLDKAGFHITVAVNISANWLSDIRLPEFILASIKDTGFKAENLILEITETGVMADMVTAMDVLTRLRLKGFKLSIDDFGTGYSSMDQLQRIPFGELKLDRGFVQGAAQKASARTILASSIEMAHKLKLTTVAEGVETQSDLDLVRGLGCDLVQGWFIAKAMPVTQLIEWLQKRES